MAAHAAEAQPAPTPQLPSGPPPSDLTPDNQAPAGGDTITVVGDRASDPAADAKKNAELAARLNALVATGDVVGMGVAIVRHGELSFMRTWGVAEVGRAEPVTPATIFRVGSLSKGFASTLVGMAMREGRLSPDQKVATFAPDFKLRGGAEAGLTLGDLLSHRTGLPSNAYDDLLEANIPLTDIIPRYQNVKLSCRPGECYAYQNIAYSLTARALFYAYGKNFDELAKARLFAPLGMTSASVGQQGLLNAPDWARPHVRTHLKGGGPFDWGPWREIAVKPAYYRVAAAGGVNASLLDMTAWLKAQMGYAPQVLKPALLDLIHAPQIVSPAETVRMRIVSRRIRTTHYAYGFRRYDYAGADVIAHGGSVDGYAAQIAWLPKEDVGIIVLCNSRSRRFWRILPVFLDIELGLPREDWMELAPRPRRAAAGKPTPAASDSAGLEP